MELKEQKDKHEKRRAREELTRPTAESMTTPVWQLVWRGHVLVDAIAEVS